MADLTVFAVDVADLALDVVAQQLVAVDTFPAGGGELHQDGVVTFGPPFRQQLRKGLQPDVDALGVVQPVDAEQDFAGIAQLGTYFLGPLPHTALSRGLVERRRVDRYRERSE